MNETRARGMMRAAVVVAPGCVEVQRVRIPEPSAGEVRVRVEGCGVCASNLSPWEGKPWFTYPFEPGALGHEAFGRIDAVGNQVNHFVDGQRVATLSYHAYAEYDIAKAEAVISLPSELDGTPVPAEPLGCAMNIFARAEIRAGDTVVILGIGFLGALLIQLAVKKHARVIALARRPFALELAKSLGASETISLADSALAIAKVKELTGGSFADVTIEAVGKQEPLDLAGELTRERGRLVIAGYHQDGPRVVNMQLWNWRGLDVINAHERDPQIYMRGIRDAVCAVIDQKIDPSPLCTHRFPLDELGTALDLTRDRPDGFMKAIIEP